MSEIFTIDGSKVYKEILKRLSASLETGKTETADIERIINVTRFMLCGKRSRDLEGGREVFISELSEEDAFDGYIFEEGYARKATVLYKD